MLDFTLTDGIAWLQLNRPDVNNAITQDFYAELIAALETVDSDPEVRCAILHGAGSSFCAGGDLKAFAALESLSDRRSYMADAMAAFRAVQTCTKPVIAAVHGYALGGGCELTLVSDIVIADATARFGMPEARAGLIPGPGSAVGLTQVNLHWMKLMVLGGEVLDAPTAQLAGLATQVVGEGEHLAAAEKLARRICGFAPVALETGKRLLNDIAPQHYDHASLAVTMLQGTDDFQEGIAAFGERRPARFQGR